MSTKVKLVSCIVGLIIAVGMLVVGVLAATSQDIFMQGNVNFVIGDRVLFVRDVQIQNGMEEPQTVPGFRQGFINGEFVLNLTEADITNNTGTFTLYFDIINLIVDGQTLEYNAVASWTSSPVAGVSFSIDEGSETIAPGTVNADDLNDSTPISGRVALEVNVNEAANFDLSNITITIIDAGKTYLPEADYAIDGGNIAINGFGDASGSVVIPEKVSVAGDGLIAGDDYTVTSIGNNTFIGNTDITSVTLPSTITSIGNGAFASCSNLTTINLPEGLTEIGEDAFTSCTKLTDIVLPDTLTKIGDMAFYNCRLLSGTLNIPASVESIGSQALVLVGLEEFTVDADSQHFTAVEGILYSKDMKELVMYPREKASENFVVPESVEVVADGALRYCTKIHGTLTLPSNLITIGEAAFADNSSWRDAVTIPASVTSIGVGAFQASNFAAINVDAGNTTYKSQDGVLYNAAMTSLLQYPAGKTDTSFTVPSTVTRIEEAAARGNTHLQTLILPSNLTYLGSFSFYSCLSLTGNLEIPSTVTRIGTAAFGLTKITSFSINNSYYTTVAGVVYDAAVTRLICYPAGSPNTEFTVPDGVTRIDSYTIRTPTNLEKVTIPASVTSIGAENFLGCTSLKTVVVDSPTIAAQLTSKTAAGHLINNATTVYVKENAALSLPEAFGDMFKETSSELGGYKKYAAII